MRLVLIIGLIVQCALLQASTLIDGLYYDMDTSNRTATVTYEVDGTGNYASLSANVKIPKSVVYNGVTFTVTKIADKAFANCTVMESITIPGTVLQIGQNTGVSDLPFYNCTSLKSVRFEDGVQSLILGSYYSSGTGYGLFSNCPLEEVYIGRNITYQNSYYNFEKHPEYYGYSAFYNQPKLANVTISSTVTEIPSCFFKGCKALNKVSIQGQLTKIPAYSFDGCQLSVLTLSNSIEEIGDYAFQNNTKLTTASLGDNVKKIGKYAFSGCTKLSILNLGNSLVTIDDYAFQSIGSDTNVGLNFEVPNTLSVIGKFAFYKSAVSSINIPNSVTTIGESCFAENTKLEKVTLGNGCGELPKNVFSGCSLLSSIVLSNGLSTISDAAFANCKVLESISIPGTVLQIGQNTSVSDLPFYNCTALKSIRFEDGVQSLILGSYYSSGTGYGLFSTCPLEEVYIGSVDPDALDVAHKLQSPSSAHWFGTDELGRDYFIRVLYGGRVSLVVGVLAMLTSIVIGVTIGMVAGYFGGIVDNILMRIVDVFSSIPWIIMVTVVGLLFKKGLASIIIVIGLFSWMEIARLVRSEVLSAKEREYVQYADFIGIPSGKVIMSHVFPTVFPTIITAATAQIASAIMVESSLSFLGLGVAAPMSSWGSLLQSSQHGKIGRAHV